MLIMESNEFWTLIKLVDIDTLDDGDEDGALVNLIAKLSTLGEEQIQGFEQRLAQLLYDLDGKVYADHAGESGASADGFLYCRCYVVARGKNFYEAVLANPAKMPKSLNQWCESLLFVSQNAWAEATGDEPEDWSYHASVDYETGGNKEAWQGH
jgi:hypothetical protein